MSGKKIVDYAEKALKCDPTLERNSDDHVAYSLILASLHVGPDKAQAACGFHPNRTEAMCNRLRLSRIWTENGVAIGGETDDETYVRFLMAVNVALGYLEVSRKRRKPGTPKKGGAT